MRHEFVLAAAVGSAAVAAVGYHEVHQRYMANGIRQTTEALRQVDKLIAENEDDAADLLFGLDIAVSQNIPKLARMTHPLGPAIDAIGQVKALYDQGKAINDGDYLQVIGKTAEVLATTWGAFDPEVAAGKEFVDFAADVYEAQALLQRQANLLESRMKLQQQLVHLQDRDQEIPAQWAELFNALHGDQTTVDAAFKRWLADHKVEKAQVLDKALHNAMAKSCRMAANTASGVSIVDPEHDIDTVAAIPDINPAFIQALRRQNQLLARGDYASVDEAMDADKDGSFNYIPIFSPSVLAQVHPAAASDRTCQTNTPAEAANTDGASPDTPEGGWKFVMTDKITDYNSSTGQAVGTCMRMEL